MQDAAELELNDGAQQHQQQAEDEDMNLDDQIIKTVTAFVASHYKHEGQVLLTLMELMAAAVVRSGSVTAVGASIIR
eukprot:6281577-Pyramimonas_sp.AAC.2